MPSIMKAFLLTLSIAPFLLLASCEQRTEFELLAAAVHSAAKELLD